MPMRGYTGPSARRVPSWAPFLMRKSSGSIWSRSQISSTTGSTSKAALVAPVVRYAEAAADLHRHHLDARNGQMEQLGQLRLHGERSLCAAPDGEVAVGVEQGRGVVRFDVALMHGRGVKFLLDDQCGGREALVRIPQ